MRLSFALLRTALYTIIVLGKTPHRKKVEYTEEQRKAMATRIFENIHLNNKGKNKTTVSD